MLYKHWIRLMGPQKAIIAGEDNETVTHVSDKLFPHTKPEPEYQDARF